MSSLQKSVSGFKASLQKASSNDRPSPSPVPSQVSNTGVSKNDLKRKRLDPTDTVYSQPLNTGTGTDIGSRIHYALEYLKKEQASKKADDVLGFLSLLDAAEMYKRKITDILKGHQKVLYDPIANTYTYRAFKDISSEEGLLKYLQNQPTAQGLKVFDLRDGWAGAEEAINKLEREGKILTVRNKKDNHPRMVWLDDPSLKFTVDPEFQEIWKQIKVPDAAAVATALQKEKLVPASKIHMQKKVIKVPEKKKKKARQGGKVTNKHMQGILKDYSHLSKDKEGKRP